jgi:hypothetical protein
MLQQARKPLQQHPFAVCTFPWRLPSLFLRLTSFSGMAARDSNTTLQQHATRRDMSSPVLFPSPSACYFNFEL